MVLGYTVWINHGIVNVSTEIKILNWLHILYVKNVNKIKTKMLILANLFFDELNNLILILEVFYKSKIKKILVEYIC